MPAGQFINLHFEWEKLEFRKNYALLAASLKPACLGPEEEREERQIRGSDDHRPRFSI